MNPRGCAAAMGGGLLVIVLFSLALRPSGETFNIEATDVSEILALPDGGFLFAERLNGVVREVGPDGALAPNPVATMTVSTQQQRGLLGLARDDGGRIFASWTGADEVLRIAQVAPGSLREVWRGPRTADLGNGGRIAFTPDGRLVVGIGDMQRPDLVDDPTAVNGKLLVLDPEGAPAQQPEVISTGWNNPFAFEIGDDGTIWVADNEPGSATERLVRVNPVGTIELLAGLPPTTAPSGITVTRTSIFVCGYASGSLLRYDRTTPGEATVVAEDCAYAVEQLADGTVVYASRDAILER